MAEIVTQTPINLLKAGGSAFFSAACVAALAKCGYSPDDFGTYDKVRQSIKDAQQQRNALQEAGAPVPADVERLANSQSGHIGMNACRQRQRGNPCANVVDGYYANQAACMPHEGGAFGANGEPDPSTEHGRYTAEEFAAPGARGITPETYRPRDPATGRLEPGSTAGATAAPESQYPASAMRADERARMQTLMQRRAEERQRETQASQQGGGPQTVAAGAAATADPAAATQGSAVAANDAPPDMAKTAEEAAECVMAFKDAMESAMRRKCADDQARNRSVANGGPNATPAEGAEHRERLRGEVDAAHAQIEPAEAEMRSQRSRLGGATGRVNRATEDWHQANEAHQRDPSPENEAARQAAADRVQAAQANQQEQRRALDWRMAEVDAAEQGRADARRASSAAENAHCLDQQADTINANQARTTGRHPLAQQGQDESATTEANEEF